MFISNFRYFPLFRVGVGLNHDGKFPGTEKEERSNGENTNAVDDEFHEYRIIIGAASFQYES